ncbi:MAG TPA: bifunctional DNA-binding transcriptional regulator/O6-methylguanine-DNA methyltransferase Ada [Lysobacter sp.]|nr:bifunctional DNA-binding transcriptional regulator/O6-methylguanine-DNA methyltransferase Ada [Lysobacter sp.]
MTLPSPNECLRAVRARDRAYDGRFVYGVVTTGVFCRPSCPARPPREENLRFFAGNDEARAAGFRPCKRCRPDQPSESERLQAAARYIERHADRPLPLAELAAQAGLSSAHFQRRFRALFGVTPRQMQDAVRMRTLKTELRKGAAVTEAIYAAGFGSPSRVYGEAARHLGMTPKAYRDGGAGEHIAWAVRDTALGPLLMAATERGVCFAQFGESAELLNAQLQREFPRATLTRSDAEHSPQLDAWIAALDAHVSRGAARPELPLDLRGTAFQMRVWRFLLGLEDGQVVSYGELAQALDLPRATRAVASACGANRIAVLVPCHRVLRGDGSLGGYRWGLERKRTLLDAERARSRR